MQKTVVALYDDVHHAQMAVRDLVDTGISRDQISLMASNASGEYGTIESTDVNRPVGETSGAAEGAGVGAGIGAALGGIGGLLVGLGALTIPGIGPVLAAGPLAAALGGVAGAGAGAIAGGAAGGLIGALTDMGVTEESAGYYAEGIRRGGTLLTVRTDDDMASRVVDVMNRHEPIDVRNRASQWRNEGWSGFDSNAGPYQSDEFNRDRTRYGTDTGVGGAGTGYTAGGMGTTGTTGTTGTEHRMSDTDYGAERRDYDELRRSTGDVSGTTGTDYTGADMDSDEGIRGAGSGDISGRGPTDYGAGGRTGSDFATSQGMTGSTGEGFGTSSTTWDTGRQDAGTGYSSGMGGQAAGMGGQAFDTYESGFRNHYTNMYGNTGYTYNQYQPAYRYGYEVANNPRYQNRDWNDIEMDVRRDWETQHPDNAWDDFKDAVRHAWYEVRNTFR